jgi:plasmid stability protein
MMMALRHIQEEQQVTQDLFVKNLPAVIKDLIAREASEHRRSVNQETIALLEEALLQRIEGQDQRRRSALETLQDYAKGFAGVELPHTGLDAQSLQRPAG